MWCRGPVDVGQGRVDGCLKQGGHKISGERRQIEDRLGAKVSGLGLSFKGRLVAAGALTLAFSSPGWVLVGPSMVSKLASKGGSSH